VRNSQWWRGGALLVSCNLSAAPVASQASAIMQLEGEVRKRETLERKVWLEM
jgi:hypothetical protein